MSEDRKLKIVNCRSLVGVSGKGSSPMSWEGFVEQLNRENWWGSGVGGGDGSM